MNRLFRQRSRIGRVSWQIGVASFFVTMFAMVAAIAGCESVSGISDYKKEGEGGFAIGSECVAATDCGAGLTCVAGACRKLCFNLADPTKECTEDSCVVLADLTEAVCFTTGTSTFVACTQPVECAPGFTCVDLVSGAGGQCLPYCHEGGTECSGADICHALTNPIVIDGVQWGVCGPTS